MPVKISDLGLLNPMMSTKKKYLSSQRSITEFIRDVTVEGEFSNVNCILAPRKKKYDGQKIWDVVNNIKLKELVVDFDSTDRRLILRAKNTGAWLNIWGITVISTVLAATEFCGF